MAFPTVASTSSGNSGSNVTSLAITMPSGATVGDLVIVCYVKDGTAASSISSGTGWSDDGGNAGSAANLDTYWKVFTGSGDNLTISHASEGAAYVAFRITGFDPGTQPHYGTAGTGTSANPNAPSLDPAGWATEDTLWIVTYGWDGNVAHSAYPSGFASNQVTNRWANSNGCGVAAATQNSAVGSMDPGNATLASSEDWIAQTLAVRPVLAATPLAPVQSSPYPYKMPHIRM